MISSTGRDVELTIGELEELEREALASIARCDDPAALEAVRLHYLGRKGLVTQAFGQLRELDPSARRRFGQRCNEAKENIQDALGKRETELEEIRLSTQLAKEWIDVSLPGRDVPLGAPHPIRLAQERVEEILRGMAFSIYEGPEIESDFYNFTALNIAPDHPARDMQDTFYLRAGTAGRTNLVGGRTEPVLLRTHTSPGQIRYMRAHAPEPIRMIAPGRVYRRDDDATHSPVFHQVEGLQVARGTSIADLKGVLAELARQLFGPATAIRLRPSYFPFTEPSVEMDVSCPMCGGRGCNLCGRGWLEILGAGMVHPVVLRNGGYDPDTVSGFAFGLGVERVAMVLYGIDDMRELFRNDFRFLDQFKAARW